jgi:adenine-specific DNA-methyltransferase
MDWLGFENHLNVFHCRKRGIPENIARRLAVYFNSTFIDLKIRSSSVHTQVKATDLKALQYPSMETLNTLGSGLKRRNNIRRKI